MKSCITEENSFEQKKTFYAVRAGKKDIGIKLVDIKNRLLNYPRIPNIISVEKKYKRFTILCEKSLDGNEKKSPEANHVYILTKAPEPGNIPTCMIEILLRKEYFTYKELLDKILPDGAKVGAFETVGKIVHLNLNEAQLMYKKEIGEILYCKTGHTVINKTGKIDNLYRFYKFEVLAGPKILETVHYENKVKIWINLEKIYWSSRLQGEREKIIRTLVPGKDILCDPFCGAGPLILPALRKGVSVYANDLNPEAVLCIRKSIDLNRFHQKFSVTYGEPEENCENKNMFCNIQNRDAKEYLESLYDKNITHFVFNLPEHSLDYIEFLSRDKKYVIHVFFFSRSTEDIPAMVFEKTGWKVLPPWIHFVRKVSPSKDVYKLEVGSSEFWSLNSK